MVPYIFSTKKEDAMPSAKGWTPVCLATCLLLTACASSQPPKPGTAAAASNVAEEKPPAIKEGPPTLVFSTFKWVEEMYLVGSSSRVSTTALVFESRGVKIALVHRAGYEGKSFVKGTPGKRVSEGEPMELPIGEEGDKGAQAAGKAVSCTREAGGDDCSTSEEGKCVSTCRGNTKVVIRDKKRLDKCIKAGADPLVGQLVKKGEQILRLKLDSPCVFLHGEALALGAWR
jgi:hypothetical protein